MKLRTHAFLILLLTTIAAGCATGGRTAGEQPSAATPAGDWRSGFLDLRWSAEEGRIYLRVDRLDEPFLYVHSLPRGVGSNDIGLDRGQLGGRHLVHLERHGSRVLLVADNTAYRAEGGTPAERRAVEESFADSVLWGFELVEETGDALVVDATDFFLRDAHGVARRLRDTDQGDFSLAADRSAIFMERTRNFPDNTEVEAILTFTGEATGDQLRAVVPEPDAVSVHQHHSFVRLPDAAYEPLEYDPRAGYFASPFGLSYKDYATPITEDLTRRLVVRHRLEEGEPLVYHLDRGTPEPVRSALLEGARWWAEAFEAAGHEAGFRVEMLPEDADPMDVRYNVIQWVHRATRGWSYGASVVDPRTGEIIKGHVTLGSLRVRQDLLLAEGLTTPYDEEADTEALEALETMALARIRQLSAHEVGHTLGLAHNYAASTEGRASVMDYPHPLVRVGDDGEADLSDAYAEGIGAWDRFAIRWAYTDFPEGQADAGRQAILEEAWAEGLEFISDADARPSGGAHPRAHLWDNGADAVTELQRLLELRARSLARFSEAAIPRGRPLATLEEALVPVYFMHRYQVEAAAKVLGGVDYHYALRGDGQGGPKIVSESDQRRSLETLLRTLDADVLVFPEAVMDLIPPRPPGWGESRELFPRNTGPTFDPVAAAAAAAEHSLRLILDPARAERLLQQETTGHGPGLAAVLDALVAKTWRAGPADGHAGVVEQAVDLRVMHGLMRLARDEAASEPVRARAWSALETLRDWLVGSPGRGGVAAYRSYAAAAIGRFLAEPERYEVPAAPEMPPGSPIGGWEAHPGYRFTGYGFN